MALLAFLGAGQTQVEGDYQQEVERGLDYLLHRAQQVPRVVDGSQQAWKGIVFRDSQWQTSYTHGLVTIALSEAFAMTHDPRLHPAVTGAIEFLVSTQGQDGGWRYTPGMPADTCVVAFQLMGLKSAQFSRVAVPPTVFQGVDRYLDSVASERGSQYSYVKDEKPRHAMTAAGLLCRMYLDWTEDNGGLQAGVRFLDECGPEKEDMYSNFYSTQVLYHWGGPEWDRWNAVMREQLVKTQIQEGHATGSWDVATPFGNFGGRLYMTTLALLTLEVYYRHLPLYQRDRIEIPLNHPLQKGAAK